MEREFSLSQLLVKPFGVRLVPVTYDSFIHYNLPVYPGALGHYVTVKRLDI